MKNTNLTSIGKKYIGKDVTALNPFVGGQVKYQTEEQKAMASSGNFAQTIRINFGNKGKSRPVEFITLNGKITGFNSPLKTKKGMTKSGTSIPKSISDDINQEWRQKYAASSFNQNLKVSAHKNFLEDWKMKQPKPATMRTWSYYVDGSDGEGGEGWRPNDVSTGAVAKKNIEAENFEGYEAANKQAWEAGYDAINKYGIIETKGNAFLENYNKAKNTSYSIQSLRKNLKKGTK